MRKKYILNRIMILFIIIISGCSAGSNIDKTSVKEEEKKMDSQKKMDPEMVAGFHNSMEEIRTEEGKSVIFEDGSVTIAEDILNENQVTGEYGFGALEHVERDGWKIDAPLSGEILTVCDDIDRFIAKADNRVLEICSASFDEEKNRLDSESGLKDVSDEFTGSMTEVFPVNYNRVVIYRGLREYEGRVYAGYVFLAEDYFEHTYQVAWFGQGNMNRIQAEAFQAFGQFAVVFDLDLWLEMKEKEG